MSGKKARADRIAAVSRLNSAGFHILSLKGLNWWSFSFSLADKVVCCSIIAPRSISTDGTPRGIPQEWFARLSSAYCETMKAEEIVVDDTFIPMVGLSSDPRSYEFNQEFAEQLAYAASGGGPEAVAGLPDSLLCGFWEAYAPFVEVVVLKNRSNPTIN